MTARTFASLREDLDRYETLTNTPWGALTPGQRDWVGAHPLKTVIGRQHDHQRALDALKEWVA